MKEVLAAGDIAVDIVGASAEEREKESWKRVGVGLGRFVAAKAGAIGKAPQQLMGKEERLEKEDREEGELGALALYSTFLSI